MRATTPRPPSLRPPPARRLPSRRGAALMGAATLACGLLAAGCSDDEPAPGGADPSSSASPAAAVAPGATLEELATWPLTGRRVPEQGTAAKTRPVVVVKMDNTPDSAPQVGLAQADLVVEELVEGGYTRLAAMYYESLPERVGPVRSMRATDIGVVSPVDAAVVTSGAASPTVARVRAAGIRFFNEEAPGFSRDTSRPVPYNLFADLTRVADEASGPERRPPDYLERGPAADLPRGREATSVSAVFSTSHTTTWRFDGDRYVNETGFAPADEAFPADSVLVLRVELGDAGYRDPSGAVVPESKLTGAGAATLFHDGRMVRGTWAKTDLDAPVELSVGTATTRRTLEVPPGRVWIELVPRGDGEVRTGP